MTTNSIVKKLSKILSWEVTPCYLSGINFVVENAELVGAVYTFPDNPIYTLTAFSCNIIEHFDADNPKHLKVFLAFLDLNPLITFYVTWDILIKHLEENGIGDITMKNVERAGCAM